MSDLRGTFAAVMIVIATIIITWGSIFLLFIARD
jgi:hypothetical protein